MGLIIPNLSFSPDPLEADDEVNVVVIDPGHGGHDPGNLGTGRYAQKEKDISSYESKIAEERPWQ